MYEMIHRSQFIISQKETLQSAFYFAVDARRMFFLVIFLTPQCSY
jgi:hypothetical protein